ncbi:MAG: hypothetical protein EOO57_00440 [Hymenobacter sp.]|nr:MAG: hypothetical protein EOO57_00440 [Hymenobacter sp.]
MNEEEAIELVFIPALATLLLSAAQRAGRPLTETEVLGLRDEAVVMAVPTSVALALETQRGFPDIDPENAWPEWQVLRSQFGGA